jgi:uncharacterized integral membrane protein
MFSLLYDTADFDHAAYLRVSYDMIYLLTAIGLTPSRSSTVHIYTQTIHRTAQLTTLVGRVPGIRAHSGQIKLTMN